MLKYYLWTKLSAFGSTIYLFSCDKQPLFFNIWLR